jgi:hypothetical protein
MTDQVTGWIEVEVRSQGTTQETRQINIGLDNPMTMLQVINIIEDEINPANKKGQREFVFEIIGRVMQ